MWTSCGLPLGLPELGLFLLLPSVSLRPHPSPQELTKGLEKGKQTTIFRGIKRVTAVHGKPCGSRTPRGGLQYIESHPAVAFRSTQHALGNRGSCLRCCGYVVFAWGLGKWKKHSSPRGLAEAPWKASVGASILCRRRLCGAMESLSAT